VAATELVLTLPSRLAGVLAKPLGLAQLTLPPELAEARFSMSLVWHARTNDDPAQRWLRGRVFDLVKSDVA
jgi:hypothetical protein